MDSLIVFRQKRWAEGLTGQESVKCKGEIWEEGKDEPADISVKLTEKTDQRSGLKVIQYDTIAFNNLQVSLHPKTHKKYVDFLRKSPKNVANGGNGWYEVDETAAIKEKMAKRSLKRAVENFINNEANEVVLLEYALSENIPVEKFGTNNLLGSRRQNILFIQEMILEKFESLLHDHIRAQAFIDDMTDTFRMYKAYVNLGFTKNVLKTHEGAIYWGDNAKGEKGKYLLEVKGLSDTSIRDTLTRFFASPNNNDAWDKLTASLKIKTSEDQARKDKS